MHLNGFAQPLEGLAAWHSMHQSYLAGFMFLLCTQCCLSTSVIGGTSLSALPHRVLQAAGASGNTSEAVQTCSARTTLPPGSNTCAYVRANCSEGAGTSVPGLLYCVVQQPSLLPCQYPCRLTCLAAASIQWTTIKVGRRGAQTRSFRTSASSTAMCSELGPLPSLLSWCAQSAGCLLCKWQVLTRAM